MIRMSLPDVANAMDARCASIMAGIQVSRITTDSRDVRRGDLFFAVRGPRFDGHAFATQAASKGAVACVVDRLWSLPEGESSGTPYLVVDDTVAALGRLAAHHRCHVMSAGTVVVAVTGSNGKTTTKQMIDHTLGRTLAGRASLKSFNNQIGVPLTLLAVEPEDEYLVVEIGSNAPGEVAELARMVSPNVAVITSIGEAHLQGLGDLEAVAAEKGSLLRFVRDSGLAVVNIDCAEIEPYLHLPANARLVTCGLASRARLSVTRIEASIHRTVFELDGRFRVELPMPGAHHATNAAATFAVARWFGLDPREIIERLATFVPPPGRTRLVEAGGVTIIDDSYNANPTSMKAALEGLQAEGARRRIFVAGDMLELGGRTQAYHTEWVQQALAAELDWLLVVGPAMQEAAMTATSGICGDRVILCDNAAAAYDALRQIVEEGDVIWVKGSRAMALDRVVAAWEIAERRQVAVA